jgi:hypothetical protein
MFTSSRDLKSSPLYFNLAVILTVALFLWLTGILNVLFVEAAQLTNLSDTLSNSSPSVLANHAIRFTTPTGVPADGSTIEISIPSGFDMSAIGEDDIDISDDGSDLTTDTSCGSANAAVSTSPQTITIEICNGGGGAIAGGSVVVVEVGTNATSSGTGTHQITNNSSEGSYELTIGGTMSDDGSTRINIVDSVTVTGSVDTYFSFNISGVNAGESVNSDTTTTFGTTTATSVAFGTVSPSTEYLLAQDLSVTTNSGNGFTVKVFADGDLTSSVGATINSFTDGTGTSTPISWTSPSAQVGQPDTYGHWGVTTEDTTLSDGDSFGSALYAGDFINNPREVMYSTSSADGTTADVGATRVGYKMEVSTMQEAAKDYTTQLTYIATPIF